MTMALGDGEFFDSYLQALSLKQLEALTEWQQERITIATKKRALGSSDESLTQDTRLAENPDEKTIADAIEKKRLIYLERRRRERTQV